MFKISVVVAVVNEYNEIAIINQTATKHVCVIGIMKTDESAEDAAIREIDEELGLCVKGLKYIRSCQDDFNELLMLGYVAFVDKAEFVLPADLDSAEWVSPGNALNLLEEGSFGWEIVKSVIDI